MRVSTKYLVDGIICHAWELTWVDDGATARTRSSVRAAMVAANAIVQVGRRAIMGRWRVSLGVNLESWTRLKRVARLYSQSATTPVPLSGGDSGGDSGGVGEFQWASVGLGGCHPCNTPANDALANGDGRHPRAAPVEPLNMQHHDPSTPNVASWPSFGFHVSRFLLNAMRATTSPCLFLSTY